MGVVSQIKDLDNSSTVAIPLRMMMFDVTETYKTLLWDCRTPDTRVKKFAMTA